MHILGHACTADLDAYISRYGGYTKLRRLEWIAQRCSALAPDCYRASLALLRQGINTQSYREICVRASQLMGPEYAEDTEWAEQVQAMLSRLLCALSYTCVSFVCTDARAQISSEEFLSVAMTACRNDCMPTFSVDRRLTIAGGAVTRRVFRG